MFMPFPMFKRIYSSMAVGGGVLGKAAGTAPITMTEAGLITEVNHLSTEIFLPVGEIITEIINGKDILGNISGYRIRTCNAIGKAGKKTNTGKGRTPGECRDYRKSGNLKEVRVGHSINKVASNINRAASNNDPLIFGKLATSNSI
jgi:hypothetical protein